MSPLLVYTFVFPAYAGVFRVWIEPITTLECLPRIRGGVSLRLPCRSFRLSSSPHTRGCFSGTRVEMSTIESSPHTRGCFRRRALPGSNGEVFPAYAGVFPRSMRLCCCRSGLPRIRGGVSALEVLLEENKKSSPHTRGCFCLRGAGFCPDGVFPAYAGVFLSATPSQRRAESLPRIRGGVSTVAYSRDVENGSSPHTRGCFQRQPAPTASPTVFPAYAGVFPAVS